MKTLRISVQNPVGLPKLGRDRALAFNAVEGIEPSDLLVRTFDEFDRLRLSPEERRAAIRRAFQTS